MENNNFDSSFFDELNDIYSQLQQPDSIMQSDANVLLDGLNPEQTQAVCHLDGPLLILAGAGSGKTRVITYRIAYMMKHHNIAPGNILAITFTNKAANEMKERIEALVGTRSQYIWCGTFHSIFARILRRHSELIGYGKNFKILDSDDQLKIVKQVMNENDIPEKLYKPKQFQYEITNAKNHMVDIKTYETLAGQDTLRKLAAKVYKLYDQKLIENNAMDFDDILINMVRLMRQDESIRDYYRNKFQYIMVDEYQDTNKPQYDAIMLLARGHNNICVVGDDDQSIYAFRGADVRMILNFEKDFPDAKIIKLEQNYRSTKTILDAANEVIANNKSRKSKALRTDGPEGEKIIVMNAENGMVEASWIADTVKRMVAKGKFSYSDVAILYRMNALSRSIESALRDKGVPFKVYGGMRFYDRKEIKDILCYLRLINDDKDNLAFERIINVPKRGIGDATIDKVRQLASDNDTDMLNICMRCTAFPELSRVAPKLAGFAALIARFRNILDEDKMSFQEFVDYVENESGVIQEIIDQRESKGELTDRVENLKELLSEASEFEKSHRPSAQDDADADTEVAGDLYFEEETKTADSLRGLLAIYLENAALYSEGDTYDEGEEYVRLMSIHSAKGLEFGVVFLIGVEDGVFPSYRTISSLDELEEERRLMYVAITRAKRNLFMLLTRQRMLFGQTQCFPPSRFLREINPEHLYKMGMANKAGSDDMKQASASNRDSARKSIASALESRYTTKNTQTARGNTNAKSQIRGGIPPEELVAGMKVVHDRFGVGTILKVEPVAGDALITVDFDGLRKNMLAKTASIRKG